MINTGQTVLVLGAIVLFAVLLPSLNESIFTSDSTRIVTQVENSAMAAAQAILMEAATLEFDEVCITTLPLNASQLTPTVALGAEPGEYYPNYDDLDDFASLSLVDTTTLSSVPLTLSAEVDYIDPANPGSTSVIQTFVKRLRVTVTSPYLIDPASRDSLQISLQRLYAFY